MRYFIVAFLILLSIQAEAQLEKAGAFVGTALVVHNYDKLNTNQHIGQGFFALRHRIGGMASFYGDELFSFESGLLFDYHEIPNERDQPFENGDKSYFSLLEHKYVNVGVPLSITMRTNSTRNCVTYFKLSLVNLFTVHEKQTVSINQFSTDPSHISEPLSSAENKFNYYSTDIDFGFGTFWYLKKIGAKFCLEPKVTLFQYRNSMRASHIPNRDLVIAHNKLLSSLGFELTLYKDLY